METNDTILAFICIFGTILFITGLYHWLMFLQSGFWVV